MDFEKKHREKCYAYDWSGACAPLSAKLYNSQETFSVGIFQWVKTSRGNHLKKTPIIYRIRGSVQHPEKVYARAEELCDLLDSGIEWKMKGKSETVR